MAGWFCERDQKREIKKGKIWMSGMDVDSSWLSYNKINYETI
jgi:hypothetical protein